MNIKTIINAQGEIVEMCVIKKEDGAYADYSIKEGEQAVDYLNEVQAITNGVAHPPLKPMWNGTQWVELATEQELLEAYPPLPLAPPTIEERTAALEAATMAIMGGI